MRFFFLLSAIFLFSCSTKTNTSEEHQQNKAVDSTVRVEHPAAKTLSPIDTGMFVGMVNALPETKELFVSAYYINQTDFDSHAADSIVYEDIDFIRRRIPLSTAKQFFRLYGLDSIRIYNEKHSPVGTVKMKRVEYIETPLSSEVGVVYEYPKGLQQTDDLLYAVSPGVEHSFVKGFSTRPNELPDLRNRILTKLNFDLNKAWVMYHYDVEPYGITLSTVSAESESYLVETEGEFSVIVGTFDDGYHFGNILPIPLDVNNKPALLVNYFVPNSDDMGNFLMVYDGEKYKGARYSRITPPQRSKD